MRRRRIGLRKASVIPSTSSSSHLVSGDHPLGCPAPCGVGVQGGGEGEAERVTQGDGGVGGVLGGHEVVVLLLPPLRVSIENSFNLFLKKEDLATDHELP